MKHRVVITFSTIKDLWQFAVYTKATSKKINTSTMTLSCECDKEEIVVAEKDFRGQVIEVFTNHYSSFTDSML